MTIARRNLIPHVAIIIVVGLGLLLTRSWPSETALFPEVGCAVVLVVAIISLISEYLAARRSTALARGGECGSIETPGQPSMRVAATVFGWLILFLAAIWAIGYEIAAVAFVFLFMKIRGSQGWRLSVLFTVVSIAFLYLVFRLLLGVIWPHGALWEALGL